MIPHATDIVASGIIYWVIGSGVGWVLIFLICTDWRTEKQKKKADEKSEKILAEAREAQRQRNAEWEAKQAKEAEDRVGSSLKGFCR